MFQSHWSANVGQGHQCKVPAVTTSRISTMQGLVVVGLIVEKIWNVDVNVSVTRALNIG